ncbi:MAG: carboxypeptidase regulatory-like domain-containing protein, partial [Blastocatellia bacterium]|nr:carboxypeptidase regulatory-like domain-containing protein [Blastocatellia bacterium]
MKSLKAIIPLILSLLAPCSGLAQGTTSRVTGTVTDQSGAAVPGATVILTNSATTRSFTTTTSAGGIFVFDSV